MKLSRKHLLAVFVIIGISGLIGTGLLTDRSRITMIGKISKDDLRQIKFAVDSETIVTTLGPPNQRKYKRLPELIKCYFARRDYQIEVRADGATQVMFRRGWQGIDGYQMEKTNGNWQVTAEIFYTFGGDHF